MRWPGWLALVLLMCLLAGFGGYSIGALLEGTTRWIVLPLCALWGIICSVLLEVTRRLVNQ